MFMKVPVKKGTFHILLFKQLMLLEMCRFQKIWDIGKQYKLLFILQLLMLSSLRRSNTCGLKWKCVFRHSLSNVRQLLSSSFRLLPSARGGGFRGYTDPSPWDEAFSYSLLKFIYPASLLRYSLVMFPLLGKNRGSSPARGRCSRA